MISRLGTWWKVYRHSHLCQLLRPSVAFTDVSILDHLDALCFLYPLSACLRTLFSHVVLRRNYVVCLPTAVHMHFGK